MPRCRAPGRSYAMMSPTPWRSSSFMIAVPAAPAPETTTRTSAELLADHPQRVGQRGQHADRGAVLVVVEDRDVEQVAQPRLDLEAARRGDVLQVDAAVRRRDGLHDRDDLVGVLGVQHHRPGVHPAEPLEQRGLALHHRQRGGRADVAQAEHGRAVGDHRDGVALDGQPAGVVRVLRDRQADPGHPRGVRAGQLVAVAQRDLRGDLDLAAEVQQEGAVGDLAHVDAVQRPPAPRPPGRRGPESAVSQVRSTTTCVGSESTTSSAVTMAPASPTRVVSRPIAEASAVTLTRMVIENPALGSRRVVTVCLSVVGDGGLGRSEHCSRPAWRAATGRLGPFGAVALPTSAAGRRISRDAAASGVSAIARTDRQH